MFIALEFLLWIVLIIIFLGCMWYHTAKDNQELKEKNKQLLADSSAKMEETRIGIESMKASYKAKIESLRTIIANEQKTHQEKLEVLSFAFSDEQQAHQNRLDDLNKERTKERRAHIAEMTELKKQLNDARNDRERLKEHFEILSTNTTAMPWLAGMMADYLTLDLEYEAKKLDWGHNVERAKKVRSIREIRADAKQRIEEAKIAIYQLEYLRKLYPALDDVLETDYRDLHFTGEIPEYDPARNYLSKEEWHSLSDTQKNQLALDRYVESRKKTNWQIGRDYELSVAYEYSSKGFAVITFGSDKRFEDLGRDLIATKNGRCHIIQCKYWAKTKTIHEKHVFQLYGTMIAYCIENNISLSDILGVFVTNTSLSEVAVNYARLLNIKVVENHEMVDFPRIKCNIGKDEFGLPTKIYHLPMDFQYDKTKIEKNGEFYAFTVQEAEEKGFRRAYKWHGAT